MDTLPFKKKLTSSYSDVYNWQLLHYPPNKHHDTHLCPSGGHTRFPGDEHLLNTMSDLYQCLVGVNYDLAIWHVYH